MKIYTRTGDDGTTALFGGPRVPKSDIRIEAYGTVDELNATVGLIRSGSDQGSTESVNEMMTEIQRLLLILGADLATPAGAKVTVPRIKSAHSQRLELFIDQLEDDLPELTKFILPGGSRAASFAHVARTVCRRAERHVVRLQETDGPQTETLIFLNRLSDFFFVAARWINKKEGSEELTWSGP